MDLQQADLPYSGRTPHARQASFLAACAAGHTKGRKARLMLRVLYPDRRLSDHGLFAALRAECPIASSSIQSIRNMLIEIGLVQDSDETEPSPYAATRDVQVVRWELTEAGRAAAAAIQVAERRGGTR